LVRFVNVAGHLGNVATVISELTEKLTPEAMLKTAQQYGETPTVQRLGYLLEVVGAQAIAAPLAQWLAEQPSRAIPLRPGHATRSSTLNSRWNIFANETIEVES
jgi:hypothetical protein